MPHMLFLFTSGAGLLLRARARKISFWRKRKKTSARMRRKGGRGDGRGRWPGQQRSYPGLEDQSPKSNRILRWIGRTVTGFTGAGFTLINFGTVGVRELPRSL